MAGIDLTKRADAYSLYFPSMQVGSAGYVCAAPGKWQDHPLPCGLEPKDFNFLDPSNKFWTYRYALASAEAFKGKKNNAVTTRTSSAFILGDSGGYQVGTGKFTGAGKLNGLPEEQIIRAWRESPMLAEITRWCQSHCDYATTLDIPPRTLRDGFAGTPFHNCRFETLLKLTIEHLGYLQDNRGRWGSCRFLNVLQGDKPSQEDAWYRGVKDYHFDGWSLAGGVGVGGGPYRMLNRLLTLRDHGLLGRGFDWVHVLGLSRLLWAPLVTAMQMAVRATENELFTISYDSSNAYMVGGRDEKYFVPRVLDADYSTWTNPGHKFPTGYGNAIEPRAISLTTVFCSGSPCAVCASGSQHLPAPLTSPITSMLKIGDLVSVKNKFARRHVGHFFDQTIINHNVYVLIDATIKANDAVFCSHPTAPQQLVDAVGLITDRLFQEENWHTALDEHRGALEAAVRYKTPALYRD